MEDSKASMGDLVKPGDSRWVGLYNGFDPSELEAVLIKNNETSADGPVVNMKILNSPQSLRKQIGMPRIERSKR